MMNPGKLRAGVAIVAILSAGTAMAGSFGLREQSAYSQGASFAGAAAPGDSISAMFWNPSAVTTATGLQTESHFTFILPRSELEVDPSKTLGGGLPGYGNGGDVGIDAFLPASYVAYQVNDSLYLGLSINSPFGLATHSETPWVGQADHLRAKVFSTAVTPTIGYKVNDMLSVGLGVSVQYFKVDLSRTLLPTSLAVVDLTGDDWGFGVTAGATFTPFEGTEIGLGFRSMITHNLDGDLESPLGTTGITADVHLPETVTLGVRQRIDDQFTLLGGIEWTNWSRLGTVPVVNDAGATATNLEFEYKDGWFFSLGGEYAWNDQLTLRAGAAYEIAPTRDEFRSMRLPDADRVWLSAGASYDFNDRLSFDAAYTHLFVDDAPIEVKLPSGLPYYGGTAKGDVDIFSVSLRYKLGG